MRENIVIKREDENLKYLVIDFGQWQISAAELIDEYEKGLKAIYLIERTEAFASELVNLVDMLKNIRSKYEDNQNA